MLKECSRTLSDDYDVAMLDLDGVVYVGREAVPGARGHLQRATESGMHLAFVTNNASRPPSVVAEHLRALGIPAENGDVVTSAQAAARLLAQQVPAGSAVFVIGGEGLFEALAERDLKPVQTISEAPSAVASGYHPELRWKTVAAGAILVRRGLPWVAANMDLTVPTAEGLSPGNGVLVNAVAGFAGRTPVVAGKPQAALFEETWLRVGGERPLVVGDRLDTDIEGAVATGLDSLLVMTGVTGVDELVRAAQPSRPSYVSADLSGLSTAHPVPSARKGGGSQLNGWWATVDGGALVVAGEGSLDDWWRVVAVTSWAYLDTAGRPAEVSAVVRPGTVGREQDEAAGGHGQEDGDGQ